jgi:hypothetical protein
MMVSLKWLRRKRILPHDVANHRVNLAVVSSRSLASGCMDHGELQLVKGSSATEVDDVLLIQQAEAFFSDQQHLKSAKLLRRVSNQRLLTAKHRRILEMACAAEEVYRELSLPHPEDQGWSQQGNTHGNRHSLIYYKVTAQTKAITFRIDIPIEASLLVPVMAVLNETDLYTTWMPHWNHPHFGLTEVKCLGEFARGHKLVLQRFDVPFPFCAREFIIDAYTVDAIRDDSDDHHREETSGVVLKIVSVGQGVTPEGAVVGPTPKGVKRVDFEAGFVIRPCPPDHPSLQQAHRSRRRNAKVRDNSTNNCDDHEEEPIMLFSALQRFDAHIDGIPMVCVNFLTRVAMGQQWNEMIKVAEEVRDGLRPALQQRIAQQHELYGWMEERARVMVSQSDQYCCR